MNSSLFSTGMNMNSNSFSTVVVFSSVQYSVQYSIQFSKIKLEKGAAVFFYYLHPLSRQTFYPLSLPMQKLFTSSESPL